MVCVRACVCVCVCPCVSVCVSVCVFNTSLIPCGKFGSTYLGMATASARAALPTPISVCSIFVCSNTGMTASVRDFNVCTDVDACDLDTGAVRVCTES